MIGANVEKRLEQVEKKIEKIERYIGETMIDAFSDVDEDRKLSEEEVNDIEKMKQTERQKKEVEKILKNKKPEELAEEFKSFIEEFKMKKYPELKEGTIGLLLSRRGWFDEHRVEELLQLFLSEKYGIDHYHYHFENKELDFNIQLTKDIVIKDYSSQYEKIRERKELEKLKEEEKLLPSLIDECYEWAKREGYNSRNFGQPSIRLFLQTKNLKLSQDTIRTISMKIQSLLKENKNKK